MTGKSLRFRDQSRHADHPKTTCLDQPTSLPNIIVAHAIQVAAVGVIGILQTGHRASVALSHCLKSGAGEEAELETPGRHAGP
jgi:hypothetical protein